ncbi:hypothetical protein [uncultured Lactobacillus sp.]|uniref:hypothetical protein n=1 Tax=uncultured Lactobacillus sp. TaxID=153152 RepID=UPI002602F5C4|nr:hypothetical protein [uncultured Lactobacillus sp.]
MLDHLILNAKKWFEISDNANTVTANGKKYIAIPVKATIPANTMITTYPNPSTQRVRQDTSILIESYYPNGTGILNTVEPAVLALGNIYANGSGECLVKVSDLKNVNWGDKSLLFAVISMVKYAFTSFKKGAETC